MNYFDAKEKYRTRSGDMFRQPDQWKSKRVGKTWRLRDCHGQPLAIIGKDRVLCQGTFQTTNHTGD